MSDQLRFDGDTGARLERMYQSGDVRRRRQLATDALVPKSGELIVDVGCGPGFHISELADLAGDSGSVVGIDVSDEMIGMARARNADRHNVEFRTGDATKLPLSNRTVDGLVAVQVLEYIDDVRTAINETYRVLKPHGRVAIIDVDWATLSWHSNDPDRMSRVLAVWDEHLAHPSLPRHLPNLLTEAGFADVEIEGYPFVNTDLDQDGYSVGLIPLIHSFASEHGIPSADVNEWMTELTELDTDGRYFFSLTKFLATATKPGTTRTRA